MTPVKIGQSQAEETVKILVIGLVALRRRPFEDPMDTVVYGLAAGLGFAAYENLVYLVRHHGDWQTLAIVRSVLTVPFHGALGVIAGAYMAMAKHGKALGSHRGGHFVRMRLIAAIWFVPVALHALFDFPLLALRGNLDDGWCGHAALQTIGLLSGFGSIALAAHLIWRIDAHHRPPLGKTSHHAAAWRAIWTILTTGGVAVLAGAAVVASQLQHGSVDRAGFNIGVLALGFALIASGSAIFWWGRRHLERFVGAR